MLSHIPAWVVVVTTFGTVCGYLARGLVRWLMLRTALGNETGEVRIRLLRELSHVKPFCPTFTWRRRDERGDRHRDDPPDLAGRALRERQRHREAMEGDTAQMRVVPTYEPADRYHGGARRAGTAASGTARLTVPPWDGNRQANGGADWA